MGLKNRAEEENRSMNEALLFATMCIIGLPVDVHLKDGSVYSGIFHTASVEKEYGIVLKKAKLTKKGRCATNVANGSVVETLVILAGDFVQVVAKGVPLPFDGFSGNIAHGNGEAFKSLPSSTPLNGAKKFNKSIMDKRKNNRKSFTPGRTENDHEGENLPQDPMGNAKEVEHQQRDGTKSEQGEDAFAVTGVGRQVGDDRLRLLQDEYERKLEFHMEESAKKVQHSVPSLDTYPTQVEVVEEGHNEITSKLFQNGAPHNAPVDGKLDNQCSERPTATDSSQEAVCYGVSTSSSPVRDVSAELCQRSLTSPAATVPPQSSESNKNSKEFKLNPRAKIFSPSFPSAISPAPPVPPTVVNVPYIPGKSPVVAVAGSQPEVGIGTFAPRSPAPSKFSYSNITAANGVTGSQFSQPPIVGQMGSRTQPLRYTGQYHPVQAAPSYLNPNSQAVTFGQFGPLVYMPVSQDLVQGTAAISPVPARPPLTQHHVQFLKHQGSTPGQALQFSVSQPFIAGGQQPLAVPPHLPPPFPANHPIQVPGLNGLYSTKRR